MCKIKFWSDHDGPGMVQKSSMNLWFMLILAIKKHEAKPDSSPVVGESIWDEV